MIRSMVASHFSFHTVSRDTVEATVSHELKGGHVDNPLIEKILLKWFFTNHNPWKRTLDGTFNRYSTEVLGLVITTVSSAESHILFYISFGSQIWISLKDWEMGILDKTTDFNNEHKEVFQKIVDGLRVKEAGAAAEKFLSDWWKAGE